MRIFIINNADGIAIAATIDEEKAIELCKENKNNNWYYQVLPLYKSDYIELTLINNKSINIR